MIFIVIDKDKIHLEIVTCHVIVNVVMALLFVRKCDAEINIVALKSLHPLDRPWRRLIYGRRRGRQRGGGYLSDK